MDPVLQHWLLNLATDFPVPFRFLPRVLDGRDGEAHALNVVALRGFSLEIGVKRLVELADADLVRFTHTQEGDDPQPVASSEVTALVSRGATQGLSFELTNAGGEAWEKTAEPRWHEMHDGFGQPSDENGDLGRWDWTFFSQNRDRLMAVLGWFSMIEGNGHGVDLNSVTWETHNEYQVRYWKHLPDVHVVDFQTQQQPEPPHDWNWIFGGAPWFSTWFSTRRDWYRKPWDLEGWPPTPETA